MTEKIRDALARALRENGQLTFGVLYPPTFYAEMADDLLARLRADGLEIVPVKPSEAMETAGFTAQQESARDAYEQAGGDVLEIYRAMLRASQS